MDTSLLAIEHLSKTFHSSSGASVQVFHDLNLFVQPREIAAILGPSGCGKTTLLNMIAGFESPDSGNMCLNGNPIKAPSPERGVVFQSPVLFPWQTVSQNIGFGLRQKGLAKKEQAVRIKKYIELVELQGFEHYYPHELSGGMQQRAALARTLILHPQLLLMDEPFSALDPLLRFSMQQLLLSIWKELNQAIVFVTHDIEEALILADRIYILGKCPKGILREIKVPKFDRQLIETLDSQQFSEFKKEIRSILFTCS